MGRAAVRLQDYLEFHARERPDAAFAIFGERRVSYAQALDQARRIANALIAEGVEDGARVAVLSKNSVDLALLYYGLAMAGVVPAPLNYRLAPREWAYIVNDAGATALFAAGEYAGAIDEIRDELESVRSYIALDAGGGAASGTASGTGEWTSFEAWAGAQSPSAPSRSFSDEHDLYQMYTSGTTGHPKGAILTHRAVTAHLTQVAGVVRLRPEERCLVVAPMYHAAGAMTTFNTIAQGGTLYILEQFDPAEVVRVLDEEEIVTATMVPAMIQACLMRAPDAAERRYASLRIIYYGGSPIAEGTLRGAMETFGCGFAQAYGMTEMTAGSTNLSEADHRRALQGRPELLLSAGRPLMGTEVRVVDEEDRPLPNGEVGEIVMRGPQTMRGYWNLADESARALRGGWMHTGDAGRIDDEGYIYILDRVKDMIVSGGENVYPRAVEDVLFQHPAVADAAVIGVPDEQWGETVKAVVVLREGQSATAKELIDFCRGRLGGFERPRSVDFVEALPRTANGKLLKRELREPYWQGHERRVAGS